MKSLIINPKKDQIPKDAVILNPDTIFSTLMTKVYQQEPNDNFIPVTTKDGHIKRFISNTDPVRVAIQDYTGKTVETALDAKNYLLKIGVEIYKDSQWIYKLVINEVKYSRERVFVMVCDNDDFVAKITEGLDGVAIVQYNKKKNKKKADADTESEADNTTAQGQENSNE